MCPAYISDMDIKLSKRARRAVFVFGSNSLGIHGTGTAKFAALYRGAGPGIGEGFFGHSYAIPVKEQPHAEMELDQVKANIATFLSFAKKSPELDFYVTRIGCGRAGFDDDVIAPLFMEAPSNCLLPGLWEQKRDPDLMRVVIAGSRDLDDDRWMHSRIDAIMQNQLSSKKVEIICGGAMGADFVGYKWAVSKGLPVLGFPAQWDVYGKSAGYLRNLEMAWAGTHLIAFMDMQKKTPGTSSMISIAKEGRLQTRLVDCHDLAKKPKLHTDRHQADEGAPAINT